jgi:GxxExxY protein
MNADISAPCTPLGVVTRFVTMNTLAAIEERRATLDRISRQVIACAYNVSNTLGAGFLEKVYENALAIELRETGLEAEQQRRIEVRYKENVVGDFLADIVVEGLVIVEVKAVKMLDPIHSAQCLNYLRGTDLNVCLLVNFGSPRAIVKRIVHNY